ncbi:MAG: 5-(carboxyamino)imidazole ribonucleotide mutase [Sporomusaceae bacterium]|jgi:5-(carboxyamino)imidazole ribonucleotide mutase|nr:5-(carboxyamino)imidazole ribonucleotide mutase [Sporomusaceae bacterium]
MKVAIIMGSDSDWPKMEAAAKTLTDLGIATEVVVASAHRTPAKVHEFASTAPERGVKVIIAAAGAAAHLAGVVASQTTLPVIGVPVNSTALNGMDALLSIAQMPAGIPVATMAIDGAKNAALFAAQILAVNNAALTAKLARHRQQMAAEVEKKGAALAAKIGQNIGEQL